MLLWLLIFFPSCVYIHLMKLKQPMCAVHTHTHTSFIYLFCLCAVFSLSFSVFQSFLFSQCSHQLLSHDTNRFAANYLPSLSNFFTEIKHRQQQQYLKKIHSFHVMVLKFRQLTKLWHACFDMNTTCVYKCVRMCAQCGTI